ncbi:MAG: biotin attachment protein [Fluviicola sp. XM-24bin1]|nr:MAG: biotin attachment protein [Fluviicola sp. XM-24bin1]
MLNISENKIQDRMNWNVFSTLNYVESKKTKRLMLRMLKWTFFTVFVVMLLPWTQNVSTTGVVTTVLPEHRPQTIHSIIAGRVDQWLVFEGQRVEKGDTLMVISEIKDAYMDDRLLERTRNQITLKKDAVVAYGDKEDAQEAQLRALNDQQKLKLQQAQIKLQQATLKVQNDSIKLQAAEIDLSTTAYQYRRADSLYSRELISLKKLEDRRLKYQSSVAKETEARNNWFNSQNELIRLRVDIATIRADYDKQIAKVLSERLTTTSNRLDSEGSINKMENQYSNYKKRSGYYYILAPQSGYVTKTFVTGIGETIKEGQAVISIMPDEYELAAEIYIDPIDLPLMHVGEHVRIQFDGWPAIVFSGWPDASYGTYGGEIYAIDQYIGDNGKYRMLIKPDERHVPWPKALRYGAGLKAMILLNDVPIWYELWRQVNGFPPEYYKPKTDKQTGDAIKEEKK